MSLAYNSLTGSLLYLTPEDGSTIRDILSGRKRSVAPPLRASLRERGFLVDSDINELNVVRELFRIGPNQAGPAQLTILPTLACNLACPYCFERHSKGLMQDDVVKALEKFADSHLLRGSTSLSVEWFGGEPLMAMTLIERLSATFRVLCDKHHLEYRAGVTTNGLLLTRSVADRLIANGVKTVQVTLDGPAEVHDRRRPTSGGRGSFEKILKNLTDLPGELEVSIRINVDAGNQDHVFPLLGFLAGEGIINRAKPYVARVEDFSEVCRSVTGRLINAVDFACFKRQLKDRCSSSGIPWFSDSRPHGVASGFCIVDTRKGFVALPDGRLLKCWAEVGNDLANEVAHLLKRETWRRPLVSPLRQRDPFDDEECCACKLLPVCMGGCPRIRANAKKNGVKLCPLIRYSLPDELRQFLDSRPAECSDARC